MLAQQAAESNPRALECKDFPSPVAELSGRHSSNVLVRTILNDGGGEVVLLALGVLQVVLAAVLVLVGLEAAGSAALALGLWMLTRAITRNP